MFFFFKQKTAYEMRISDWSSDVCSSDLRSDGEGDRPRSGWWKGPYASVSRLRRLPSPHSLREQGGAFMIRAFRAELLSIGQDPRDALDAVRYEIGRAACRERGCQYVSISVVAGSLKKKKITMYIR